MAIQAPVIPKIRGNIINERTINTNVLANEIIAETLPLDRAVKKPEDAILKPLNKKLTAKSLKPADASSYVRLSFVNTATTVGEKIMAAATIITDETATAIKKIL